MTKAPPRSGSGGRGRIRGLLARVLGRTAPALLGALLLAMAAPSGAEDRTLTVGILATLDGAFAPLGKDALRGYELAVAEYGDGPAGLRIDALIESTDGTPESATAKARLLVERGAQVIIGPLAGTESIALRDFARTVPEVTIVNGASAAQDATLRAPTQNFFRFTPDSMQWIAGLGRYAYERKGIRTIVAVAEDYSLPHTQLMGFMLDYCALGGRVLARHWLSPGVSDTARIADTVAGTETDALFVALSPGVMESFLDAYGNAGGRAAIVAGSTTLNGGLLDAGGDVRALLEGAIAALPVAASEDNEAWVAFARRYRARFPEAGPTPSYFALAYYVNTKALYLALERSGGDLGDGHEALRAALAGLRFETPFGAPVALDANRQAVTAAFIVEVAEAADGALAQRTVHTVPEVGQTLGLAREAFLALGPPGRDGPRCEDLSALARAAPTTTDETATEGPDEDAPPAMDEEDATPEPEVASAPVHDHPLLRREEDAAMTAPAPQIVPCLSYRDAPAAIAWLKEAFGFVENMVVPGPDGTIAHAQLAFGAGLVMVGSEREDELAMRSPCALGGNTHSIYVVVEDIDAHHARAVAAGAQIVRPLQDTPYGSRDYSAHDPEGHIWNFGTYRPAMEEPTATE